MSEQTIECVYKCIVSEIRISAFKYKDAGQNLICADNGEEIVVFKLLKKIAILFLLIGGFASALYYIEFSLRLGNAKDMTCWNNFMKVCTVFLNTVQNTIGCFFFTPSLNSKEWATVVIKESKWKLIPLGFKYLVWLLYSIVLFLAPLLTIYVSILHIFRRYIIQIHNWIEDILPCKKFKQIYIFGASQHVKEILDSADVGEHITIIVNNEEEWKLKQEMLSYRSDFLILNLKNRENLKTLEKRLAKSIRKIKDSDDKIKVLLMEESDILNYQILSALEELNEDVRLQLAIYMKCEKTTIRKLTEQKYEKKKEKDDKKFDEVSFFSNTLLQVNQLLNKSGIKNRELPSKPNAEFNAIIIGFSSVGQEIINRIVNLAVLSSSGRITIHIYDHHMKARQKEYFANLNHEYCGLTENEEGGKICIPNPKAECKEKSCADGILEICFHDMDINHYPFKKMLSEEVSCHDYVFICLNDADTCVDCMIQMKDYMLDKDLLYSFPVCAIAENSDQISELMLLNRDGEKKFIPDMRITGVTECRSLQAIINDEETKKAKQFHNIYGAMKIITSKKEKEEEKEEEFKAWNGLPYFKQYSNYLVSERQELMHKMIEKWCNKLGENSEQKIDPEYLLSYIHLERETPAPDKKTICYRYPYDNGCENTEVGDKKIEEYISENEFLNELCAIEQRRWCYERALTGWKYEKRNDDKKAHDCLTSWKNMPDEKRKYNLLPLLYEVEKNMKKL